MNDSTASAPKPASPRWQPIGPIERRVAGVLVEKAKTVPSAYPMSLNAVVTAANQKSNRFPVMAMQPEQVEESLDRLRQLGAVGLIQGYGRVSKYRHYLYDWLGADKVELAVMAELLLRGAQTEGEIRAHAARMEPIPDLTALRPVLASLKEKGLVISLSPEGRGHVVSHALYQPRELEALKAQYAGGFTAMEAASGEAGLGEEAASGAARAQAIAGSRAVAPVPPSPGTRTAADDAIRLAPRELDELRAQVAAIRGELDELGATLRQMDAELQRLKRELGA